MLYRTVSEFSPTPVLKKLVCLVVALGLALSLTTAAARSFQASGELRFELPANGNLRVENLRGGVMVQVWAENYVSVGAIGDNGQSSATAPVVDRGEALLSVR